MEALHGVSVAALNVYEMLSAIDPGLEINGVKILKSKGDKAQYHDKPKQPVKAVVIVCSDSISSGAKQDLAGKTIINKLNEYGVITDDYIIIPDERYRYMWNY